MLQQVQLGANGINAVAIGTGAKAIVKNTISIGTGNVVSGVGSGAIGDPTIITGAGTYSLGNDNGTIAASNSGVFGNNNNIKGATSGNRVIGNNNTVEVTANNALIFGNNAGVSAANGIAIGEKSASTSEGSIAFGLNSKAGNGSGATFGLAKDAIAIGTNSSARGDKAVAIGKGTQANHDSNIAIGNSAETGRDLTVSNYDIKNISIGYEAGKGMNGQFNSYLGTNAGQDSKGDGNSAFGLRAGKTVTGNTNTAIGMDSGQNVKASSNTAIGLNAGQNVTANGGGSNAAIGTNAGQNVTTTSSGGGDNIAIGTNAGRNVTSSIGHNTAVGHSAGQNIIGTNNVAFGSGSGQNVVGDNNTSMGINAGIGVKSSSNVSIGSDSGQNTDGVGNTAIGYQAGQKVTGGHNISMGYQSAKGLNGGSNTIIGFQAGQEIVGGNNIIVGTNATKKVTVDNVVSIGTNSIASTNNSVAVDSYSKATGNAAIAIGQGSNASKDNSMAIGNRSTVNAVKDVAIGSDSSTSATTGVSKATITVPGTGKSITYGTFAGSNPDAAFSVGSAGRERQIQNVAAGRVTATSTDAINGSQLFAVANELGKTWKANAGGNLSGSATSTQVMPGDEVQFVAGKNLEVEQNLATGSQKYTYSLKKDVDLGSTGSLKVGPVTINNNGIDAGNKKITNVAPGTADTDAANVSQVKAAKTTVSSDDNSITVTETTKPDGHKNYDLSVDVTKLDAANKSLSNINNDGNKVISGIARKSIDVVAGTNIKNIVKNDVQNLDGTTTTTYTINANGARVVAGDGVTVATGTPGSNNITDYTVSVKNTTLTAAPGSTTVTAGDNNSYAKAGDVATAITNVGKASKTTVTSNDSSVAVVSKVDSGDGHVNYDLSVDTSKVAVNTNLTYKANSGTGLTTTLANGLDFKDGDNTKATVGPNGEVKYSLNPTVAGINSITTNGGNTVINDNGITTPKVTINNAPTAGTDATNKDYVDSTKTKVTSNDSSVVINKTTSGNQDVYDLSVDVTKLDAANKSLSNINNDGNKVISGIARKSIDVVAGTNIKNIVKNDVQNLDGTTTTTYTINANGARVVAGDGVTVATGTPGSNNITDYTVSVKNTTLTAAPGSTTVTAGDNNSYAKAGDVATAITNVGKASKTTVTSNDSSVTVVSKVDSGDGHVNYDLSVDTSKVAANTNLTYKANSGTGLTTTLANGLDFKDGDNTVATVGPNGEVKYSLNPTVTGINSITTNGGNTVINDSGITTPKVTINNAPTAGTDATNKDYVDSTKTKVTSNDSSVVINKTTSGNQDVYDLSVDVTKLDAANKSLSNINNDGNKVISGIARKSIDVVAGTNIKNIVKNDVQNLDGTTTTTYTINANGARVVAGDGVTVATGTPGSNNITDYTVSVKNTTLTAAPGSTTVTAGDNNSYAKAGDVATAITNVGKASKTTVTSNDSSVTVVSKVDSGDGHVNYDLSVDTSKVAANTNLTYKANSGTGLTTTLANGLDFKDGDNTIATVGPNGEVKYSLNPTVAGINSITTNGGNTVINDNGVTTPSLTLTNSTPLTSSTGGKVTVPTGTGNQAVTGQTVANAINKLGDNTINLKASDGNITTKQSLNKDGGLEFNITGSNGITTTASGDTINVTIAQSGLNTSTTGGKTTVTPVTGGNTYATAGDVATAIQNAVNNSGWNAVAGSTGTVTTSGSVSNKLITPGETVKLQAGDNLNVDQSGGTFTYSLKNDINVNSITAGNNKFDTSGLIISDAAGNKAITTPSGTTYTNAAGNTTVINPTGVVINKSAADPSKSVSLTDNGLDNGGNKITNVAAGVNPTDAVNVSQLKNAVNNATYNGPVVYTNAAGEKIVKANNGNYYKALDVDSDGNPLPGKLPVSSSDIQHSLLNADGSTTNPSTLDNVGKGKISSSSKQAINGSQLNNLGTQLGLTVDPSGTGFSNPTFAGLKNVNGSTGAAPTTFKDAVDQTIAKVNEGIIYGADNNTAGTRQQLGSRLTVESGDFASGGVNYKGQNLETSYVSDGAGNGKIIVGITENPEFNSVKAKTFTADDGAGNTTVTNGQGTTITDAAGNKNVATAAGNTYTNAAGNTTTVNSSGVTINKSAADPSKSVSLTNSGLDNGGNRITNIAAGVAPTDAVNVSQLGNAVNNLTTAINASKSEVVGGTNTNVTSSTGSNGQIVYKVDADGTTVSGGSSFVSVTQGTKDANNITDYKVDLAQGTKDKLNSIGTGNIAAGDNNTVTGSTVHNYIQNNPLTYTDDNGTTVTRNLGQNLNIMGRATGPLTTGNIGVVAAGPDTLELRLAENVDLGPNGRVTMGKTVVNDDGIKITGGPSVTSSGIDAGGKKVTNIAEGDISPTSNDAVTGRQVYNAISAGAADKATRAELAGVNNNLTAGIAGVAAMANLPQINDSASNRFNIAVAGGAYKNGRAMALGFSGVSDGGRFVYRASASLNNKRDVAVGLGVGYQFGKRDVMPNELDRMKSMVALIEEQKDSYSRQLKQQLEQESRKNQENSELIRQLMQEVQELKSKSNVSNRSNRS